MIWNWINQYFRCLFSISRVSSKSPFVTQETEKIYNWRVLLQYFERYIFLCNVCTYISIKFSILNQRIIQTAVSKKLKTCASYMTRPNEKWPHNPSTTSNRQNPNHPRTREPETYFFFQKHFKMFYISLTFLLTVCLQSNDESKRLQCKWLVFFYYLSKTGNSKRKQYRSSWSCLTTQNRGKIVWRHLV